MLLNRTIMLAAALMPLCESMAQPAIGEALRTGELQIPRPTKAKAPGPVIPSATKPAQPKSDTPINVVKVSLRGNRSMETEELRPLLAKLEGRTLTLGELDTACAEITETYRRRGYFLARAFLPEQDVTDGNLVIEISEAWLEFVRIDNSSLVTNGSIRRKLSAIEVGDVLQVDKLDEAIAAASELAGIIITDVSVSPGINQGATVMNLTARPTAQLSGAAYLDNYGVLYTGRNRFGYNLNYASPFERGDSLTLAGITTEKSGLASYLLRYESPLTQRWDAALNLSRTNYMLGESYAALGAQGFADTAEFEVMRTLRQGAGFKHHAAASVGHRKLEDEIGSTQLVTGRRDTFATLSYNYRGDLGDPSHGTTTRVVVRLTAGNISFDDAASQALDAAGSRTQGAYQKLDLMASHELFLNEDFSLHLSTRAQRSLDGKNLDGSQKIGLSGFDGVRAYSPSEMLGDNGYLLRSELRINTWARNEFSALPFLFLDNARSSGGNSASSVVTRSISAMGLGVACGQGSWRLNLEFAHRLENDQALAEPTSDSRILARLAVFF